MGHSDSFPSLQHSHTQKQSSMTFSPASEVQKPSNDDYVKETFAKFGLNFDMLGSGVGAGGSEISSSRLEEGGVVEERVRRVLDFITDFNVEAVI